RSAQRRADRCRELHPAREVRRGDLRAGDSGRGIAGAGAAAGRAAGHAGGDAGAAADASTDAAGHDRLSTDDGRNSAGTRDLRRHINWAGALRRPGHSSRVPRIVEGTMTRTLFPAVLLLLAAAPLAAQEPEPRVDRIGHVVAIVG